MTVYSKKEAAIAAIEAGIVKPGNVLNITGDTDTGVFHIVTVHGADVYFEMVNAAPPFARRRYSIREQRP